jgi:hypothetical protein
VFPNHETAEAAVKELAGDGFAMKDLSLIGKGYHSDEKVTGFYNTGDRVKFWGSRGAFWGGFWGLFFGGIFMTIPVVGHVIILGYLAATALSMVEGAVVVGGLSAFGAALYSIGIPKDSVLTYEADMKADRFIVMAHGNDEDVERARKILATLYPTRLEVVHGQIAEPAIKVAEPV